MPEASTTIQSVSLRSDGGLELALSVPESLLGIELETLDGARSKADVIREDGNAPDKGVVYLLPGGEPVTRVWARLDEDPNAEGELLLDRLFAANNQEFSEIFRSKSNRPDDQNLVYFIARQLSEHFAGSPWFRVGAAVVLGYKACESGRPELIEHALDALEKAKPLLEQCDIASSPRVNREHLWFSLLCVELHLHIALEHREAVRDIFEQVFTGCESVTNMQTPSFPINLVLLLAALAAKVEGRETDFGQILQQMELVYRRSVEDGSTRNTTWFGELRVAHEALWIALRLRDQFDPDGNNERLMRKVFDRAFRVNGAALDRLRDSFNAIFLN